MASIQRPTRQMIERYGSSGFRISGAEFAQPVLVLADRTLPWNVKSIDEMSFESLEEVVKFGGVEVLLIGCGTRMVMLSRSLRAQLKQAGIVADAMDTGAACRTFNVLMMEERHVAAALIPVIPEGR